MSKVVVIGSANTDFTVKVERLPREGETILGGEFYIAYGGKGANQALAALKSGVEVIFIAKLGRDPHGEQLYRHLNASGLPPEGLLRDDALPSGVALIVVDREGRNQIAVAPGSNKNLTVQDVEQCEPLIGQGRILLVQLEIPLAAVQRALQIAKAHGLITIVNPAPAHPLPKGFLRLPDLLTPNEAEAGALSGIDVKDLDSAAFAGRKLLAEGCQRIILTLGEKGALLIQGGLIRHFPAFSVEAVDSTAAGDAFNGTLAAALAEGKALEEALIFASAAGALATTKRGAQDSLPGRGEIEAFLQRSPLDPA